jgi:hypothetical protein
LTLSLHDFLRVTINASGQELTVQQNWRTSGGVSWRSSEGQKWWLYMRLFKVGVRTDLFMGEEEVVWGDRLQSTKGLIKNEEEYARADAQPGSDPDYRGRL